MSRLLLSLAVLFILPSTAVHADEIADQKAREDFIRSGFAHSEENQLIVPATNQVTVEDLKNWGVVASWDFFRSSDVLVDQVQGLRLESKLDEKLVGKDSSLGFARPDNCFYHSMKTALLFQRGQYLELNAHDSQKFTLAAGQSVTVGGWIRARKDQYRGTVISSWLPFMSKMPANGVHSPGDWEFMSAGNLVYLAVHRNQGGFPQRNVFSASLSSAWWADDPATCYTGGTHVDCWHFIALSMDVSKNLPEARMTLVRDYVRGQSVASDYSKSSVQAIGLPTLPSMHDAQSTVRIGANQLEYFEGQIGSLFFANKALSPEQLKAIANQSRCQ
jgi:hypothetical protein